MESQGQKTSNNPKAMLSSLMSKRQKLQEELRSIEKQVYELETSYLQESSNFGNIWKGFEGFLSSSKNTAKGYLTARSPQFISACDGSTSLKTKMSESLRGALNVLEAEELGVGREDGKPELGPGRPKGGGLTINGPGKPKKGRTGPRDGRKIRLSNDLDLDDEEDADMGGLR